MATYLPNFYSYFTVCETDVMLGFIPLEVHVKPVRNPLPPVVVEAKW